MKDDLKLLTGESDDKLLSLLLDRAKNIIFFETNRSKLDKKLEPLQLEIALELYNKLGTEGEVSRSQGGVSVTYDTDVSPRLKRLLQNYRLARSGGCVFEKE